MRAACSVMKKNSYKRTFKKKKATLTRKQDTYFRFIILIAFKFVFELQAELKLNCVSSKSLSWESYKKAKVEKFESDKMFDIFNTLEISFSEKKISSQIRTLTSTSKTQSKNKIIFDRNYIYIAKTRYAIKQKLLKQWKKWNPIFNKCLKWSNDKSQIEVKWFCQLSRILLTSIVSGLSPSK